MDSTNIKKDITINNIIYIYNKYNNIIIKDTKVIITKTKIYKKKHVQYVMIMSAEKYIKMMQEPSNKRTYIKNRG